jgi:hypothetical protein
LAVDLDQRERVAENIGEHGPDCVDWIVSVELIEGRPRRITEGGVGRRDASHATGHDRSFVGSPSPSVVSPQHHMPS